MDLSKKLENFYRQDDHFKQVLDELFANYFLNIEGELTRERREQFTTFFLAVNDLLDEGWRDDG